MNQLDGLFKEKLADHTIAPSASAWDRIESGLSKKNNPILWMRWAAVVVPAALAGLLWLNKSEPTASIATQPTETATPTVVKANELSPSTADATPVVRKNTNSTKKNTAKNPVVVAGSDGITNIASSPESTTMTDVTIEPTEEEQAPPVAVTRPIVLVYTLESIAPANPPVTEEVKSTSLQRVVDFASTVKHSDPIGDLRGMKDELLAINLRKKTTKKN